MTCVVTTGALRIFDNDGAVTISDSAFRQNTGNVFGGAIVIEDSVGAVNISDSDFIANTAILRSGGTIQCV